MRAPALGWQLALAFVLSFLFLAGLIGWLQNVHIITGNGMYKAIQAEPWIADFGNARLDPSNYLYFPLYALLARLLDALGILKGVTWKQFAYLNAFWAALAIVFVYAFVLRLTGRVAVAVLAALFHLGCGTFLLLGVINEDIMPAYALLLASMLLAGLWFDRPTYARVALVGAIFTLGWLIEWRLMFPTLPAFVLALAFAPGTVRRRAAMIATLIVSILAVSGVVELLWEGHNGAVGLHDILWTGKGVFKEGEHDVTGWAGLSLDKTWMMLAGVGNYFLLIGGFVDPLSAKHAATGLSISVLIQFVLFIVTVVLLWPRRHEPRVRCLALVFLGTLGAGEVLNFYSQPQDPQMQVNVMVWLTVTWALLLAALQRARHDACAPGRAVDRATRLERERARTLSWRRHRLARRTRPARAALPADRDRVPLLGLRADPGLAVRAMEPQLGHVLSTRRSRRHRRRTRSSNGSRSRRVR